MGSPACIGDPGVRQQGHAARSRLCTALLPPSLGPLPGAATWNGSLLVLLIDSICPFCKCAPKLWTALQRGLHCFCTRFSWCLRRPLHLMSALLWTLEVYKEEVARQASSQALILLLSKWPSSAATLPGMLPPWMSVVGGQGGTVSYAFTVYFLPNCLSLLSIEILWAGYKMGRHRAVDGRPWI